MQWFNSSTSKQTKRTSRRQAEIKFEKMPCQDKAPTRGASHVDLLAPPPNADHWISPSSLNRASSVLIAQFHSPIIKLDSPPTQVETPFLTKLQFWTKTDLLRFGSEIARVIRAEKQSLIEVKFWTFISYFISASYFQSEQSKTRPNLDLSLSIDLKLDKCTSFMQEREVGTEEGKGAGQSLSQGDQAPHAGCGPWQDAPHPNLSTNTLPVPGWPSAPSGDHFSQRTATYLAIRSKNKTIPLRLWKIILGRLVAQTFPNKWRGNLD